MRRILYYALFILLLCTYVTEGTTTVINAFNSGELSPLLEGRIDVKKYYSGCSVLENMVVLPHGGVTKRPGTGYIAAAKYVDRVCRLIPFEYSITQAYIVEVGDEYLRFYMDGGQILSGSSPYEIVTAYDANELFAVQYAQSADIMYMVDGTDPPQQLTRSAHTAWTIADMSIETGPFLDENITTTQDVNATAVTGSVTLNSNFQMFDEEHVGSLWQISHIVDSDSISDILDANESSDSNLAVFGAYVFTTHGTWTGYVALERSEDDGSTWEEVPAGSRYGKDDTNILWDEGSEDVADVIYQVTMSQYVSGTCTYHLVVDSRVHNGIVEITAYTDPNTVTATVLTTLASTASTYRWSEGYWSDYRGWPTSVSFYEERLVFGGSASYPQTIWFSATDDWENFALGADDTDAMAFTIAADQVNAIRWLVPQTALLMGTTGGEWKISASSTTEPLTPTNVAVRRQSTHGCADLQPVVTNDTILYLQRQDKKIRQLQYSWERDVWFSPDLTLVSEHITGDGIVQLALQRNPYVVLWCVREDGALVGLTLEETQEVIGWHRHEFGGDVESAAVIPGSAEDELWLLVNRTINGRTVRYVEQLQPFDWGADQEDGFFVDSGLTYDGGATLTISAITQAFPAVVTAKSHGFSDGDQLRVASVVGMTELNDNVYTVGTVVDVNSFQLRDRTDIVDINSVSYTLYVSGGTATIVENTFTTLTHLEAETITASGDGGYAGTGTVSFGAITLNDYYNTVHVGIPYTAKIQPMKLGIATSPGMLFAATQRITDVTLRLHETLACDIGESWTSYDSCVFRKVSDPLEAAPPLYSGNKDIAFSGDYEKAGSIYIQNRLPVPLTLLALRAEFELYP